MCDRYSMAWNEFVWIEAIFTFAYMWIFAILKINWGVHSVWGIVVYYNVGSLESSCKACLYPKMSTLMYVKKNKKYTKQTFVLWLMTIIQLIMSFFSDSLINAWTSFRIIMCICVFNIGFLKKITSQHDNLPLVYALVSTTRKAQIPPTLLYIVVGDPVITGRLWSHFCFVPS